MGLAAAGPGLSAVEQRPAAFPAAQGRLEEEEAGPAPLEAVSAAGMAEASAEVAKGGAES